MSPKSPLKTFLWWGSHTQTVASSFKFNTPTELPFSSRWLQPWFNNHHFSYYQNSVRKSWECAQLLHLSEKQTNIQTPVYTCICLPHSHSFSIAQWPPGQHASYLGTPNNCDQFFLSRGDTLVLLSTSTPDWHRLQVRHKHSFKYFSWKIQKPRVINISPWKIQVLAI